MSSKEIEALRKVLIRVQQGLLVASVAVGFLAGVLIG